MYVDIGMDLAVRASQVLGVFDLDNTSWSKRTREFCSARRKTAASSRRPTSFLNRLSSRRNTGKRACT